MSLKVASEHEVIREKFDAHKDGQDGSELRNKYEVPHFFSERCRTACPMVFVLGVYLRSIPFVTWSLRSKRLRLAVAIGYRWTQIYG